MTLTEIIIGALLATGYNSNYVELSSLNVHSGNYLLPLVYDPSHFGRSPKRDGYLYDIKPVLAAREIDDDIRFVLSNMRCVRPKQTINPFMSSENRPEAVNRRYFRRKVTF